jgi:protein-S-isoprenylcysteine O-methyltransferase Ste14
MSNNAAHNVWWQIFEVVFGIPFLIAIGLHLAIPLSFPRGTLTPLLTILGIALLITGTILVVRVRQEFSRYGQPTDPGRPTSKIITTGVFSVSRNPLYLGGICILVGFALAFNLPWALVLLLPAIIACHYVLITPEERYLAAKFGEEYRLYTKAVHRWIGRK